MGFFVANVLFKNHRELMNGRLQLGYNLIVLAFVTISLLICTLTPHKCAKLLKALALMTSYISLMKSLILAQTKNAPRHL